MKKIKAIITGTTGMVGRGVLLECLENPAVESVLVINRSSINLTHPKLKEIIHSDFYNLTPIAAELAGYNAVYFCLGVSSAGMKEEQYYKLTYDLTTHFAETVASAERDLTFCYVSGEGTDSTEKGRMMWARVKGKTENKILSMGFSDAYVFRPGFIYPSRGEKPKSKIVANSIAVLKFLFPVLKFLFPNHVTSTMNIGRAMINVTLYGSELKHLRSNDIDKLSKKQ